MLLTNTSFRVQRRSVVLRDNDKKPAQIRIAGDAARRMVRMDLCFGKWIELTLDQSADLRNALYHAEGAIQPFALDQGEHTPAPKFDDSGCLLRVSGDWMRRQVMIDMPLQRKFLALTLEQSRELRTALDRCEEALRMQHC